MKNSNKYTDELNIFSLIWFLLAKWKSIVAIALIGLILGVAFAAIQTSEPITEANVVSEDNYEYEAAKQIYEAGQSRVDAVSQYLAESAFMSINPYEVYKGVVCYTVDGEQSKINGIDASIYSFVMDGALMRDLAEVGPYTVQDFDILLNIGQDQETVIVTDNQYGQTTFRVSVMAGKESEVLDLLEQMELSVNTFLGDLLANQEITAFECVNSEVRLIMSGPISDNQSYLRGKLNDEKANLIAYKTNLDELDAMGMESTTTASAESSLLKYGIIGFVAGFVVVVVLWVLIYLLSGKLYSVNDKQKRFDVNLLGTVYNYEKLRGIDLWIAHKHNGVYSTLSLSEQRKIIALNIKNELKKNEAAQKVYLASTNQDTQAEMLLLKSSLEEAGYSVSGCGSVIGNSAALKTLSDVDAVILIESNKTSKTSFVCEELNILKQYVDNVLGMVVIQSKL